MTVPAGHAMDDVAHTFEKHSFFALHAVVHDRDVMLVIVIKAGIVAAGFEGFQQLLAQRSILRVRGKDESWSGRNRKFPPLSLRRAASRFRNATWFK